MSDTPENPQPGFPNEPLDSPHQAAAPGSTMPPPPGAVPPPGSVPGSGSPQPPGPVPMLESEARTISMWIHYASAIVALISGGTLSFAVPLVMWLIYRERSALVDFHGKQNLNLQITFVIVALGAMVIGVGTLFIGFIITGPLWLAYAIYALVISFVAGSAAQRGEYYRIKMVIPFVK